MIIFGTSGITSVQRRGSFHCPACGAGATYQEKVVRRYFSLFFVPLIPLHKVGEYVQCDRCGGSFKPEVLHWNGGVPPVGPPGSPPPLPPAFPGGPPIPRAPQPMVHGTTVSYQSNGIARASMILGIVGLLTSFLICPSIFLVAASLVMGIIGLNRANKGGGMVGGKGQAITGIVCSSLGIIALFAVPALVLKDGGGHAERSPRQLAESALTGTARETAHGNSPKAVELAGKYAKAMELAHNLAFDSNRKRSKQARYVVHCELRGDSCAFLAYVPDYRKFTDDAKGTLEEIAWKTAAEVLKSDGSIKPDTDMCVGLKGLVLFGSVMTGKANGGTPDETSKNESDMDRFFTVTVDAPAAGPAEKTE